MMIIFSSPGAHYLQGIVSVPVLDLNLAARSDTEPESLCVVLDPETHLHSEHFS